MNTTKILTEDKIWNEVWETHSLPQVFKDKFNPYYVERLDAFFHKYLPKSKGYEFLELGCAPGRWLHYFNYEFGYIVSGLDSSKVGLEITKKNLEMLGVNSHLYLGDVLKYETNKEYDVVFSLGLIEHFDPPTEIIEKHLQFVKSGGYVVIGVPNIKKAFYGPLQRLVNKKNPSGYIHISDEELYDHLKTKIEILFCGYVGVLNFYLLNIPRRRKISHKLLNITQFLLDKIIRNFNVRKETKLFSPYIFIIGKKI